MRKLLLTFHEYILEQETVTPDTAIATTSTDGPKAPETERQAKSRIAARLVKSLFGDVSGVTGSIDGEIALTKEVKDSTPYRGCGASDPFKLEKTPIPAGAFKAILSYLQEKGVGDYKRAIKELDEKRAVVIGVRNFIDVKKETANQDRFTDSIYFIPGNITAGVTGSTGPAAAKESNIISFDKFSNINEDVFKKMKDAREKIASGGKTPSTTTDSTAVNIGPNITPYQITTVPSLSYYGKNPLNPKGTGIKMPGDTLYFLKEQKLGHGTYKMMVEGEKIKVGRYPVGVTKFETYKPADVTTEDCGMEIHRSSTKGVGICVGPWSAGCQVFSDYSEFQEFISKAEKEQMNNGKFIYALIQLDDIGKENMNKAIRGESLSGSALAATSAPSATGTTGAISNQAGKLSKLGRIT